MKSSYLFILFSIFWKFGLPNNSDYIVDSGSYYTDKGTEYYINGDYETADYYYNSALRYTIDIFGPEHIKVAHSLLNTGIIKKNYWNYDQAIEDYERARKIYNIKSEIEDIGYLNINMANLYSKMGDLNFTEQYLNHNLSILQNANNPELKRIKAASLNNLGYLEFQRNNTKSAINYYIVTLSQFYSIMHPISICNVYENLADCYFALNKPDSSYYYLNKSLQLATKNNTPIYIGNAHLGLSFYYQAKGNEKLSLTHLQLAEKEYSRNKLDLSYYLRLYDNYAEHYRHFAKHKQAFSYYQKSIEILTRNKLQDEFETPPLTAYANQFEAIKVLRKKAACLIDWYKQSGNSKLLTQALSALKIAGQLVDISRNGYISFESKLILAENESLIYQLGLYAAANLYQSTRQTEYLDKAFYFADRSKSSVLEGTLQEQKAKNVSGIPDSLLRQENDLKRSIARYKDLIYHENQNYEPDSAKIARWKTDLLGFSEKYEALKKHMESNYKNYQQLKYQSPDISISAVQAKLSKNQSLIEFNLSDSLLHIFCITRNQSAYYTVPFGSKELVLTEKFLSSIKTFNYLAQSGTIYSEFEQMGHKLYQLLFGAIPKNLLKENLIVVPDKILAYLPFETLIYETVPGEPATFLNMNYLNNLHSLSYSYSSFLFAESQSAVKRRLLNRALAFAPEYKQGQQIGDPARFSQLVVDRNSLSPLPFAREEAELVARLTHGKLVAGNLATEENFLADASAYRILHLAMHTLIDDSDPLYSKLIFYSDSTVNNGLLTTQEIFSLNLDAGMTVLSACSSGDGDYKSGEGVLSLARGFFYAGCPSLIMTRWKVDDESGLQLMKYFYSALMNGYSKPKALQIARFKYLENAPAEKQHPFYWSNYIVIGNTAPIYFSSRTGLFIFIVFAGLGAGMFFKLRKPKREKRVLSDPKLCNRDRIL